MEVFLLVVFRNKNAMQFSRSWTTRAVCSWGSLFGRFLLLDGNLYMPIRKQCSGRRMCSVSHSVAQFILQSRRALCGGFDLCSRYLPVSKWSAVCRWHLQNAIFRSVYSILCFFSGTCEDKPNQNILTIRLKWRLLDRSVLGQHKTDASAFYHRFRIFSQLSLHGQV